MVVIERCRWCAHWDWKQDICGTSITCLNKVVNGEEPTRFTDIRMTLVREMAKKEVK